MNRAQRRQAARTPGGQAVRDYADTYCCPDCLSDTGEVEQLTNGVYYVEIRHDDSCPTLRGIVGDLR